MMDGRGLTTAVAQERGGGDKGVTPVNMKAHREECFAQALLQQLSSVEGLQAAWQWDRSPLPIRREGGVCDVRHVGPTFLFRERSFSSLMPSSSCSLTSFCMLGDSFCQMPGSSLVST